MNFICQIVFIFYDPNCSKVAYDGTVMKFSRRWYTDIERLKGEIARMWKSTIWTRQKSEWEYPPPSDIISGMVRHIANAFNGDSALSFDSFVRNEDQSFALPIFLKVDF